MLKLHVLASGSKGNAAIIENAETGAGVLIDCGICKRDFLARCDEAGFDPTRLEAVFITHEHGDHTKGLGVVLRGLAKLGCAPMVYVNHACVDNSSTLQKIAGDFETATLGAALTLSQDENASEGRNGAFACDERIVRAAGLRMLPFATSHDAAASFGFRVESPDGDALGYITDSGIVTSAAHAALRDVRILALESNHDERMLKNGDYLLRNESPRSSATSQTRRPPKSSQPSSPNRAQPAFAHPKPSSPCTSRKTITTTTFRERRSRRASPSPTATRAFFAATRAASRA